MPDRVKSRHLNDFLGRFDFRHFGRVTLDDAQDPVAVGVNGVTPPSSIHDLVLSFAGVDGVPHAALVPNVLDVD